MADERITVVLWGVEVSRCRGVEVSGCRGVGVSRCRGVEVSRCRGVEVSGCRGVEVSRCRGVEVSGCRGVGVSRCRGFRVSEWVWASFTTDWSIRSSQLRNFCEKNCVPLRFNAPKPTPQPNVTNVTSVTNVTNVIEVPPLTLAPTQRTTNNDQRSTINDQRTTHTHTSILQFYNLTVLRFYDLTASRHVVTRHDLTSSSRGSYCRLHAPNRRMPPKRRWPRFMPSFFRVGRPLSGLCRRRGVRPGFLRFPCAR